MSLEPTEAGTPPVMGNAAPVMKLPIGTAGSEPLGVQAFGK